MDQSVHLIDHVHRLGHEQRDQTDEEPVFDFIFLYLPLEFSSFRFWGSRTDLILHTSYTISCVLSSVIDMCTQNYESLCTINRNKPK